MVRDIFKRCTIGTNGSLGRDKGTTDASLVEPCLYQAAAPVTQKSVNKFPTLVDAEVNYCQNCEQSRQNCQKMKMIKLVKKYTKSVQICRQKL